VKHDVDSFHLFASVCLDDTLSDGAHQCGTDGSNELLCSGRAVALPEEYRSTTLRPDRDCRLVSQGENMHRVSLSNIARIAGLVALMSAACFGQFSSSIQGIIEIGNIGNRF